jgi:hypothetical protein
VGTFDPVDPVAVAGLGSPPRQPSLFSGLLAAGAAPLAPSRRSRRSHLGTLRSCAFPLSVTALHFGGGPPQLLLAHANECRAQNLITPSEEPSASCIQAPAS